MSKNEYVYTEGMLEGNPDNTYNYTYGNAWKDQLTSFDGSSIVYDNSGNPTSYLGKTLTWSRGRLLTKYVSGSKTVDMEYDARGIRVGKTRKIGTSVTTNSTYIYDNSGKLRTETQGTATRNYIYGADGIVGYEENNEQFMYRKNFFGDIVAIYQGATKIAEYNYDAWGNCTIVSDYNGYGARNPFRYRGYYFDNDLGMYYLLTRYYDPKIGRFINADSFEYLEPKTINGLNLYAYCGNNPIINVDPTGTFFALVASLVVLFIVDTVIETTILMNSEKYSVENVFDGDAVHIEHSALFNNPIAQYIYSNYLFENTKNEDGSNYFTGTTLDILAEWQVHNLVSWAPVALTVLGAITGNIPTLAIGALASAALHPRTFSTDLEDSIEAEKDRPYLYYPVKFLMYFYDLFQ